LNVLFQKVFLKDLAAIPSKTRAQVERFVFEDVPQAESIQAVGKIERCRAMRATIKPALVIIE
jgi:hypothetical protein